MKSLSTATTFAEAIAKEEHGRSSEASSGEAVLPRCILIVPAESDMPAANTARLIAGYLQHEIGFRVLMVDGRLSDLLDSPETDTTGPAVAGFAQIASGLADDVDSLLVRQAGNEWYELPSGDAHQRLTHLSIRQGYRTILEQVGDRFDYIIIHTLEPEECSVAKALAAMADIAGICVEDRKTNASRMKRAWDLLKDHDANHLSVILEKRSQEWLIRLHRKLQELLPFKLPFGS